MKRLRSQITMASVLAVVLLPAVLAEAELQFLLPLQRTAYQTNERIDLAVVRSGNEPLAAGDLLVAITGDDGSSMEFTFPVAAVPAVGPNARRTEHLHLNGRLLRPGHYRMQVSADGATAETEIDVYSHVRRTSFKVMQWQHANPDPARTGEDSIGFNLVYGNYRQADSIRRGEQSIRGGMDFMQRCTQGGGHQMDLRMECDWSDPYVLGGGTARMGHQAFINRTLPNCAGVHAYDEPGLTWHRHPGSGEMTPHDIPSQMQAYRAAFGRDRTLYYQIDPNNPDHAGEWYHWGRWKLSFMEAAWRLARFSVSYVRPDYLTTTQTVYGWNAYADGYYFNIHRSLPVVSGHGGYDHILAGYLTPSYWLEMGRCRSYAAPLWYLPTWSGPNAPRYRLEQYLSLMTNVQGLMGDPNLQPARPSTSQWGAEPGLVEANVVMARLGTIFTSMPVTRPPVALLHSLSNNLYAQSKDMSDNYNGAGHHDKLLFAYLAGQMIHTPLFPVVEEDVLDGTLAANHKAVVLAGIDYLDRRVITALERFAASGGAVLLSDDCTVGIKGGTKIGAAVDKSLVETISRLYREQRPGEVARVNTEGNYLKAAEPLARALKAQLGRAGIGPVLECDQPGIVARRQAAGDIEYLFAANASFDDERNTRCALKPVAATIGIPAGRPVYDAMLGGEEKQFAGRGDRLVGTFRFGPGQMRVFARTARPIGTVKAHTPILSTDFTLEEAPARVKIGATLLDQQGGVLCGAAPLRVRVIDPLGAGRYDLYRATEQGTFAMDLPLAINDPAGEWKVAVKDLLANTEETVSFSYAPPDQSGAPAGAERRAVYFGRDRMNIYRFFRLHHDVTVVPGASDYSRAAAQRLANILVPWDVRCTIVDAAEASRPREITQQQAGTWAGLNPGRVTPGPGNDPRLVGFALRGPAVLLGTPEDNPPITFVQANGFLPYNAARDVFPGRGRGMVAWQRDAVRYGEESIALIAYDAEGMSEAVGTMYEAAIGLEPLTPWEVPASSSITAATRADASPVPTAAWQIVLSDRAAGVKALPGGRAALLTQDGSLSVVNSSGQVEWRKTFAGGESWAIDASADGEVIAVGASTHVIAFGGKGQALFDVPVGKDTPVTVAFVAASADGGQVAVGAADGRLVLLGRNGDPRVEYRRC